MVLNMARKTPTVTDTRLTFYDEYTDQDVFVCDIVSDWQAWQDWLNDEQHKSVRFVAADKTSCRGMSKVQAMIANFRDLIDL
jgi:hypothetical protein